MANKLIELTKKKTSLDIEFLSRASLSWFKNEIKNLQSADLARDITKLKRKAPFEVGGLYHFFYDPLLKKKLPYYDNFPLVIPLSKGSDGFTGLNLHYLPPMQRAIFLDKLIDFDFETNKDEQRRMKVSYDILSATRSLKEFKPCMKYYLNSQIRSKIIPIKTSEWETAVFLPTAIFIGARESKVHAESIKRIR